MDEFRGLLRSRLAGRGDLARLSETSGIASHVLGRWRDGIGRPTDKNLRRLAPALGVPYEDLAKMCGYFPGEPAVDPNPRLTAFITWVESAFHAMSAQEWDVREPAGRALFSVPPADAMTHPVRPAKTSRRSVNGRSGPDDPTLDNTLQSHWNGLHPLKAALAMSS